MSGELLSLLKNKQGGSEIFEHLADLVRSSV